MTIGELAAHNNLKPSAIRFYEKTGLLPAPARRNGRRLYSFEADHQLALICFAKEIGFNLAEIRLFLHGFPQNTPPGARWTKLASSKISELENSIADARAMVRMLRGIMQCRCKTIEQCARALSGHRSRRPRSAAKR